MDERIGDDVVDPVNGTHILNIPGSSSMLPINEIIRPGEDDYSNNSKHQRLRIVDAKDQDRIVSSEHASASPRCLDNASLMVEELTLRNYDGEKMTVVGASNGREQMSIRQNQWQNLYQLAGGKGHVVSCTRVDDSNNLFTELLNGNQPLENNEHNVTEENSLCNDDKGASGEISYPSGGIRTKILSKFGFSEYFVKNSLIDKKATHRSQTGGRYCTKRSLLYGVVHPLETPTSTSICDGVNLREWLETSGKKLKKVEKMGIFRQVIDLVDLSHSRGAPLQDLRPSCFKLSGSHQVIYLGSSLQEGTRENFKDQDIHRDVKRPMHQNILHLDNHYVKKHKSGENMDLIQSWPQFSARSAIRTASLCISGVEGADTKDLINNLDEENNPGPENKSNRKFVGNTAPNAAQSLKKSASVMLEEKWYSSPELFSEKCCTFASNIYCLGVLLFELLASVDSGRSHVAAMSDLSHRILPPRFLSEHPKEAGFCLWLLHPEPSLRPSTREILLSEFMSAPENLNESEMLSSIEEDDKESELLLHFLLLLNEKKQNDVSSLVDQIKCIEADIQEIKKRRPKISSGSSSSGGNASLETSSKISSGNYTETRLMSNIKQFEGAYLSMRSNIQLSESAIVKQRDGELLRSRENGCTVPVANEDKYDATDCLGGFYDGLCKYARYSKMKVRGVVRSGEFKSSLNVVCSLSFDRDEEYLAAGSVSKKIKIFEFRDLCNDSVDIHYPAVEMSNKSKLSCVCWNSYIRNYLASTDYEGVVNLWDASTGEGFSQFAEHRLRAWSVDFSRVDPMRLASGSDDRSVKIWSINERSSVCTITNTANVCCVQFSPCSTHLLSFSSADYKTYCFDLRNVSTPWCVLAGHEKAVSYAKFLDAETIVSASTDNSLKVWDLKRTSSDSFSRDACVLTLTGHTNEKNFVGMAVANGYIACGSETNEVYAYHRSLPMPIAACKFGSIDPVTGKETELDNGQFLSSVCWKQQSNMVVAANSSGHIKLLELI